MGRWYVCCEVVYVVFYIQWDVSHQVKVKFVQVVAFQCSCQHTHTLRSPLTNVIIVWLCAIHSFLILLRLMAHAPKVFLCCR